MKAQSDRGERGEGERKERAEGKILSESLPRYTDGVDQREREERGRKEAQKKMRRERRRERREREEKRKRGKRELRAQRGGEIEHRRQATRKREIFKSYECIIRTNIKLGDSPANFLINQEGYGHTTRAPPGVSLPSGSRTWNFQILDPAFKPLRCSGGTLHEYIYTDGGRPGKVRARGAGAAAVVEPAREQVALLYIIYIYIYIIISDVRGVSD
jgi:hypothetical protein